jgi:hypothetical protein
MKVILVRFITPKIGAYSLGEGVNDGVLNFSRIPIFDNKKIPVISKHSIVEISKFDVDIFLGLLRMAGKELPELEYNILLRIAFSGIFDCYLDLDPYDQTLLYAVGVEKLAKEMGMPSSFVEEVDISLIIEELMKKSFEEIIETGIKVNKKREEAYTSCLIDENERAGCWSIDHNDEPFDPQRLLLDEYDIVVVYHDGKMSVSIYYNKKSDIDFNEHKTIEGVEFSGGDGAVHSAKGVLISTDKLNEICDYVLFDHRHE